MSEMVNYEGIFDILIALLLVLGPTNRSLQLYICIYTEHAHLDIRQVLFIIKKTPMYGYCY